MKIDLYISSLSGGGAEKVLITLAQEFYERGHDTTIITLEKRQQFYSVPTGIEVIRICNNTGKLKSTINDYRDIRKCITTRKADVVISFLLRCNLLVLLAGIGTGQKIIVSDRNNPIREHSRFVFYIQNIIYRRANKIVVQTQQIKSFYKKRLQNKIEVIENPIDTKSLDKQITVRPQRGRRIISIGRLEKQKDFSTLIKAFCGISAQFPDWKLDIYGIGDNEEKLHKQIKGCGMEERISLCGRTDKPYMEMCASSIFVLSSFYEGFPNVLCEAMYAGNLCIASDCVSGPKELITQGENGWLFPVGDEEKLTQCLDFAIKHEEELDNIRDNAVSTVRMLSIDNIMEKWLQIIRGV